MQNNRLQAADVGFRPLYPGCRSFWYQSKSTRQSATSTLAQALRAPFPVQQFHGTRQGNASAHIHSLRWKTCQGFDFFWEIPRYLQVPGAKRSFLSLSHDFEIKFYWHLPSEKHLRNCSLLTSASCRCGAFGTILVHHAGPSRTETDGSTGSSQVKWQHPADGNLWSMKKRTFISEGSQWICALLLGLTPFSHTCGELGKFAQIWKFFQLLRDCGRNNWMQMASCQFFIVRNDLWLIIAGFLVGFQQQYVHAKKRFNDWNMEHSCMSTSSTPAVLMELQDLKNQ